MRKANDLKERFLERYQQTIKCWNQLKNNPDIRAVMRFTWEFLKLIIPIIFRKLLDTFF